MNAQSRNELYIRVGRNVILAGAATVAASVFAYKKLKKS